jgi:hypothetical protein
MPEGPEPLDRPEDLKQSRYGLTQLLDGSLLGTGEHQLGGRFSRLDQESARRCPRLLYATEFGTATTSTI